MNMCFEVKFSEIIKLIHKPRRYTQSACKSSLVIVFICKVHDAPWTQWICSAQNSTNCKVRIPGVGEGGLTATEVMFSVQIRSLFTYRKKQMAFWKAQQRNFILSFLTSVAFCISQTQRKMVTQKPQKETTTHVFSLSPPLVISKLNVESVGKMCTYQKVK